MKMLVVDTSALIRLYLPDGPLPQELEPTLEAAIRSEAAALVPELALIEATQVLIKKERADILSADEAKLILQNILRLPLDIVGHRDLLVPAHRLAHVYALTANDALFIALASRHGAGLATCDAELQQAWLRHTKS